MPGSESATCHRHGSAEGHAVSGVRRFGIGQAHHAERVRQPAEPGEDRNEQGDLKGERSGEISYTHVKYVRKAGAPGAVTYTHDTTFWLRVEPARLERLLAP